MNGGPENIFVHFYKLRPLLLTKKAESGRNTFFASWIFIPVSTPTNADFGLTRVDTGKNFARLKFRPMLTP